jgi:hypothetical protein
MGIDVANIDIKLSQNVLNTDNPLKTNPAGNNGSLGAVFDSIAVVGHNVNNQHTYYSSWSFLGSTLRLNFSDGAYRIYTGVVRTDPYAQSGTATVTGAEFHQDGLVSLASSGRVTLDYQIVNNSLSISGGQGTTSAGKLATLLPSYSPSYDAIRGNVSIGYEGALYQDRAGNTSGSVAKVSAAADKFILSSVIEGDFHLSGNLVDIGNGLGHASVTGNLSRYATDYRDGSHLYINDISTYLGAGQVLDRSLLLDASRFGGDDTIALNLPGNLSEDFTMAAGAGRDQVTLTGGGGRLNLDAGAGNDSVAIVSDHHRVDGGSGVDTVRYAGSRAQYQVGQDSAQLNVTTNGAAGVDRLTNVERVQFADKAVAFDIAGNSGQAYRAYQAAFDRKPDTGGLSYWISVLDAGHTLREVADAFVHSGEFNSLYGSNVNDRDFLLKLYSNVLHRAPDQGGFDFWLSTFGQGNTRADVLAFFSESPENQAQVIGAIQHGIEYTPII